MKRARLTVSLLLLAPFLVAPVCSRSILPNTQSNPGLPVPGNFKASQATVEPLLIDAHANSVLALGMGNWDGVEPCNACNGLNCVLPWINYPAGWPAGGQHDETVGNQRWRCNFDFTTLDQYLQVHADPSASRATRRHFMVQLAPVFSIDRKTPPYLQGIPFDSATLKAKYHRLLDWALPVLNAHVAGYGDPVVAVGIGNEVNAYLNSQPNQAAAWAQYKSFVQDAVSYMHASWSGSTLLFATVSTTYYGFCGVGDGAWALPDCTNASLVADAVDLMSQTDLLAFTYYPYSLNDIPGITSVVSADMRIMDSYASSTSRGVVIQEAGYPTSGSPTPKSTQREFVNALFTAAQSSQNIWSVNYFPLTDFAAWRMKTAFFNDTGTVKSTTDWNNFKTQMAPNNCNISAGVCCAKSCVTSSSSLQCGSTGCGSLSGGANACCAGTILGNHVACDSQVSNAPCVLNCNSSVCCATSCVDASGNFQCGSTNCSALAGGSSSCCTGTILAGSRHCDGDPSRAPCIRP